MRRPVSALLMVFILILLCGNVHSQKKAQVMADINQCEIGDKIYIYLYDGSTIIGKLIEKGETGISIEADFGEMTIAYDKIEKVSREPVEPYEQSRIFSNPNYTRLLFAPTGRNLKAGEGYFSDIYIFFPNVAYGLTDNISMGVGVTIIPGIDIDKQVLFFTPKVGFNVARNFDLALGSFILRFPVDFDDEADESDWVGLLFGMGTFGTLDHSVTLGLGYGFVNDEMAEKPLLIIGGEARLSQGIALVTENWVLPGVEDEAISYGIRFFGRKLAIDLAMITTIDETFNFPGFPYIDFVINF